MHDLVIRDGLVADGLGGEPYVADIAVDGDQIVTVGKVKADAKRELDAKGLLVTPGFIDVHTHLDAQIGWDSMLTPVSWHGVTTALLGNCGVTFAPCGPNDRDVLASMMETVEDIPKEAILGGLPWSWENYGGYLDAIESLNPAINVAGLVGHCAVRLYVMGDRGVEGKPTPQEQARIAQVVAESVDAGAVGFSTSRFLGHFMPDGRHVPGTHAEHDELVDIAKVVGQRGALMQNVLNFTKDLEGEFELLRKQARQPGARVLFSTGSGNSDSSGQRVSAVLDDMNDAGLDVSGVSIPRPGGLVVGLQATLPWRGGQWRALQKMPLSERLTAIRNPQTRALLVADAKEKPSRLDAAQMFWMGEGAQPNYVGGADQSLSALASAAGEAPVETWLRLADRSDGRTLFTVRFFNPNLKAHQELLTSKHCLPGLGDAGAHVGQIMDGGWTSFVLSHWVNTAGAYTVGEAIRRMTSAPARIVGFQDRGILAAGKRADINVLDLAQVGERQPEIVHDFPGGAARFIQRGHGYRATLVNGEFLLENDELTGVCAGRVLRHQAS